VLGAFVKPENRLATLPSVGRIARLRDEFLLYRVEQAVVVVFPLAQLQEVEAGLRIQTRPQRRVRRSGIKTHKYRQTHCNGHTPMQRAALAAQVISSRVAMPSLKTTQRRKADSRNEARRRQAQTQQTGIGKEPLGQGPCVSQKPCPQETSPTALTSCSRRQVALCFCFLVFKNFLHELFFRVKKQNLFTTSLRSQRNSIGRGKERLVC